FAARLGWQVDAVDQSSNGAAKANVLAGAGGVHVNYTVGSLEKQSYRPHYYDAAALIFVHLPPGIRSQVHERITAALRPGGMLIMEAFHTSQLGRDTGGPRSVEMLYNAEILRYDFSGLEILKMDELEVDLNEGPFHRGAARVIRMIGRKPNKSINGSGTEA
ncbi:MAG: class I SAM-dependent methyltransferase, partial [Bacteroidales bacterium]